MIEISEGTHWYPSVHRLDVSSSNNNADQREVYFQGEEGGKPFGTRLGTIASFSGDVDKNFIMKPIVMKFETAKDVLLPMTSVISAYGPDDAFRLTSRKWAGCWPAFTHWTSYRDPKTVDYNIRSWWARSGGVTGEVADFDHGIGSTLQILLGQIAEVATKYKNEVCHQIAGLFGDKSICDKLDGLISKCASAADAAKDTVKLIIEKVFWNGKEIVVKVGDSIKDGFDKFIGKIGEHLVKLAKEMLGIPEDVKLEALAKPFAKPSEPELWSAALSEMMKLMQMTTDNVIGWIGETKGGAMAMAAYDIISNVVERKSNVLELAKTYLGDIGDISGLVNKLPELAIQELRKAAETAVFGAVKKMATDLIAKIAGGPVGILKTAVDIVAAIFQQCDKLKSLFDTIKDMFATIVSSTVPELGTKFETTLVALMEPAVNVLANALGIGGSVKAIKDALQSLRDKAKTLVQNFANQLFDKFDVLFKKFGQGEKGTPIALPVESKSGKVSVVVTDQGVYIGMSRKCLFDDIRCKIKPDKREEVKKLIDDIDRAEVKGAAQKEHENLKNGVKPESPYKSNIAAGGPKTAILVAKKTKLVEVIEESMITDEESAKSKQTPPSPTYGGTVTLRFKDKGGKVIEEPVGTSAKIVLTPDNIGGARCNLASTAWVGPLQAAVGSLLQRGHILASCLGGKERGAPNHTPLHAFANEPVMRTCEGFLAKLITSCKYCSVSLDVTVNYPENMGDLSSATPILADSVTMSWRVLEPNNGSHGSFEIKNIKESPVIPQCLVATLPCRTCEEKTP